MSTPHDDDAPPAPIDTVTTPDLDLVDRLDGAIRDTKRGAANFARRAGAVVKLAAMAPRLARAYRDLDRIARARLGVIERRNEEIARLREEAADAYARGRREAIEEAASVVGSLPRGTWGDSSGARSPWPVAVDAFRKLGGQS